LTVEKRFLFMPTQNPKGKPFYRDMPMFRKDGKWLVKQDGQWHEFGGTEKDIEWRGTDTGTEPKKQYAVRVSKKTLHDDLQGLKSSQRWVMTTLRLYANAQGICWPSMGLLAKDTGLSLRTVWQNIQILDKKGFIKIEKKRGARGWPKNNYRLLK
jgi:biotin operon repressor